MAEQNVYFAATKIHQKARTMRRDARGLHSSPSAVYSLRSSPKRDTSGKRTDKGRRERSDIRIPPKAML